MAVGLRSLMTERRFTASSGRSRRIAPEVADRHDDAE